MKYKANRCNRFHEGIELLIKARPAEFLTAEELLYLTSVTDPCTACQIMTSDLSPMTGRFYKITWDVVKKTMPDCRGNVVDLFHAE